MTNSKPLYEGERIKELIPQRSPIMMVDTFVDANEKECHTSLSILPDNIFCEDGKFLEPGIIEHIAQSAAAYAGYSAKLKGGEPKIGYIGEIKNFKLSSLPNVGDKVETTLTIVSEVLNVTLVNAETKVGDSLVASLSMKIFIRED